MRKIYLALLIVVLILIVIAVYYFSTSTAPSIIIETILGVIQEQETETPTSPSATPSQQIKKNATGGGGAGGEDEGIGGSGPEIPANATKVNYTLNVNSFPEGLQMLTNYSINDISIVFEGSAPYSVLVESGTMACVLLSSNVKGGTVINWLVDGEGECISYPCSGFTGCGIYMDGPHTVSVYFSTPELE